jgi:hypothetical protein
VSKKREPCLHCEINKAIEAAMVAHKVDASEDSTQRWVLHALAAVVSDHLMAVHLTYRVIAISEFLGKTMAYIETETQEEVAAPEAGEHVH